MSYQYPEENREHAGSGSRPLLIRGAIMIFFMICLGIAQSVLCAVAVVQFAWMLIKSERNEFVARFGASLGLWLAETASFLSGDRDEKPFPWKPWPEL